MSASVAVPSLCAIISAASVCTVTGDPVGKSCSTPGVMDFSPAVSRTTLSQLSCPASISSLERGELKSELTASGSVCPRA